MPLYFDDLVIGQRFTSDVHEMTEGDIRDFAARFDPQPFHLDPDAARHSLFGGLAASGWHTAAVTMRLLVASVPFAGGLVGAGGEVTWPRPTRPGDHLHVVSEVLSTRASRSKPDRGMVTTRCETRNQHDEPVQILLATMVVPRRPTAA
jgi:acyl dehydratase